MGDLAADKEFKLEFLVISTDSCQTHRAWIDRREEGAPVAMLGDMTGHGGGGAGCQCDWKGWVGSWRSVGCFGFSQRRLYWGC